jgi:hypothetical protein
MPSMACLADSLPDSNSLPLQQVIDAPSSSLYIKADKGES